MAKKTIKPKKRSKGTQVQSKNLADRVALVEKSLLRSDLPQYFPGDTVRVHVRIKEGEKERIQIFEGVVIARSNRGASRSLIVRKISHGVGVERVFLETSPKVAKLEVVQEGRVRRAKLYYLRNLEGKAARVAREVETQVQQTQQAQSAASAVGPSSKT